MTGTLPPTTLPRRVLASSTGSHNGVRYVLEADDAGNLILYPQLWSRRLEATLSVFCLAFGAAWSLGMIRVTGEHWPVLVGVPLMIVVSFAVVFIYRAVGRAEVERGPVLTWSPDTQTLALPRAGLSFPHRRLVALELFGRWESVSDSWVRTRVLDLVVREEAGRVTTRHTIVADASKLQDLARTLAENLRVPLEHIRR